MRLREVTAFRTPGWTNRTRISPRIITLWQEVAGRVPLMFIVLGTCYLFLGVVGSSMISPPPLGSLAQGQSRRIESKGGRRGKRETIGQRYWEAPNALFGCEFSPNLGVGSSSPTHETTVDRSGGGNNYLIFFSSRTFNLTRTIFGRPFAH